MTLTSAIREKKPTPRRVPNQRTILAGVWFWVLAYECFRGNWRPRWVDRQEMKKRAAMFLGDVGLLEEATFIRGCGQAESAFKNRALIEMEGHNIQLTTYGVEFAHDAFTRGWDSWCKDCETVRKIADRRGR